ncbi:hypothetical protein V1477_010722 [Vespula maculifrons]|uniref:Uncharacterized protein n=1 Tax=Vespula maculifrons TaxID=7453 RepID=A0ABD2C2S9_VESMC
MPDYKPRNFRKKKTYRSTLNILADHLYTSEYSEFQLELEKCLLAIPKRI